MGERLEEETLHLKMQEFEDEIKEVNEDVASDQEYYDQPSGTFGMSDMKTPRSPQPSKTNVILDESPSTHMSIKRRKTNVIANNSSHFGSKSPYRRSTGNNLDSAL